jgi:hypothetical protein
MPSLAAALSAPEEIKPAAAESIAPVNAPAPLAIPEMILLAPLDATAVPPADAIVLGASESPKEEPAPPAIDAVPNGAEKKTDGPAFAPEPGFAKVVEFTPAPASPRHDELIGVGGKKIMEAHEPAPTDGHFDPGTNAATKPFNFVKRWFVSRSGG